MAIKKSATVDPAVEGSETLDNQENDSSLLNPLNSSQRQLEEKDDLLLLENSSLNEIQISLISEIRKQFDPKENVADMCLLYEVTGYKDESS